jgi:hypothetical protein
MMIGHRRNNFGYVPEPNCDGCHDAAKDETLCERCEYYDECNGIPTCNGNEFVEREREDEE